MLKILISVIVNEISKKKKKKKIERRCVACLWKKKRTGGSSVAEAKAHALHVWGPGV